jgi:enterochelin esterase-like enzyme
MRVIAQLLVIATLSGSGAVAQQATAGDVGSLETALDARSLEAALAANPQGAEAERLAERIRQAFGGRDALLEGAQPLIDETTVAWAIERPEGDQRPPRILLPSGNRSYPMRQVGTTGVYAVARTFASGEGFAWMYDLGNGRTGGGTIEVYNVHPDSREQPGVPKGTLTQMPPWESQVFPGTTRDWWVYVPAQYQAGVPAAVMVFQDGASAREYVVPVLDNLIAKEDIPVMVGIFLEPGGVDRPRDNRSFEYDRLSDQYARLLLEEILPEVQKTVDLRTDAASRAIAGQSSGGIAAFTVAWERPDEFRKVLSGIGSFTNLQAGESGHGGGHNYEALVRRTPPKPIRIFMQDGENDLDNRAGSWWLANVTLARSLAFAGYDYHFEQGKGFHSNAHMRAILPDALRWLWRE